MNPIKKLPLSIVTGTSGVGKSTLCERLFQTERGYIVMESDLLWNDVYDTPADGYRNYREVWMRLCRPISPKSKCPSCSAAAGFRNRSSAVASGNTSPAFTIWRPSATAPIRLRDTTGLDPARAAAAADQ